MTTSKHGRTAKSASGRHGGKPFTGKDDPRNGSGWPKGTSGNPGGISSSIAIARDEARAIAARHAPTAVKRLTQIMLNPQPLDAIARAAADSLLDRGLGKPAAAVDVDQQIADRLREIFGRLRDKLDANTYRLVLEGIAEGGTTNATLAREDPGSSDPDAAG